MEEEDVEKLIDYVSTMTEHYSIEPSIILSDLKDHETKQEEVRFQVYQSLEGQAFCSECSNYKLKDEKADEYYCPRCS